jgi:hypothetical protein
MCLLDRPACRTIRGFDAREFERPPAIIAAASLELRCMVRKSEQVFPKKLFETKSRGVELCLSLFEPPLRDQHIGKTPPNLRTSAGSRWQEQDFRVTGLILAHINFRQVHSRLHVARQVGDRASIP